MIVRKPPVLVLVLLCLGVGILVSFQRRLPKGGRAPVTEALTQLSAFATSLRVFRDHNGFYPFRLQDLVHRPVGATNWHGPYAADIPQDPWGRSYVYRCPGEHTKEGFPYDLLSLGPTEKTNVIANWSEAPLRPGLRP